MVILITIDTEKCRKDGFIPYLKKAGYGVAIEKKVSGWCHSLTTNEQLNYNNFTISVFKSNKSVYWVLTSLSSSTVATSSCFLRESAWNPGNLTLKYGVRTCESGQLDKYIRKTFDQGVFMSDFTS